MKKSLVFVWLLALLGISFVMLGAHLLPLGGTEGAGAGRFFGRFHPLILHFPVVLLSLVLLTELCRPLKFYHQVKPIIAPLLVLAALSAVATVVLGLLLGVNEGHAGALIDRHRSRGIGVAILSCIAAAVYYSALLTKSKVAWSGYIASFLGAVGLMGLTAHDGGSLVHGPTYLADHAPEFLKPVLMTHTDDKKKVAAANVDGGDSPLSPELLASFESDVGGFFGAYCSRCHGDGKQEANVHLGEFDPTFQEYMSQHHWGRVLGVLGSHRMPPEDAKQPSDQSRGKAISWIQNALREYAYVRRADRANAPLRRLNKRELNHVYQDIFNLKSNFASVLPADPRSEHGYDTDANLLMVSMSDLRFYQDIARSAVDRYVHVTELQDDTEHFFVEMEDIYHFGRNEGDNLSHERAPGPLSIEDIEQIKEKRAGRKPEFRYRKYGPLPYGLIPTGDVRGVGEGRGFARLHEQFMLLRTQKRRGEVKIKVHAAMTPGAEGDESVPRLRLEAGWRKVQSLRVSNIGEYDVTASKDEPGIYEFKFRLEDVIIPEKGRRDPDSDESWLLLVLSNAARHENGALAGSIYGQVDPNLPSYATEDVPFIEQAEAAAEYQEVGYKKWEEGGVPYLYFDAVEATITPVESGIQSPWLIKPPADESYEAAASRMLETLREFLPVVFRRPVSDSDIKSYLELFSALYNAGDTFEVAVRETMAAALISPQFLYIGFPEDDIVANVADAEKMRQNQYLASRLSFFIWSSKPDLRLQTLADNLELTDPAVLSQEVDRMLADPKARRMMRTFANQWLRLDKVSNVGVSTELYPDFGPEFADLIAEETRSTVEDVFVHNRDARQLYSSEYMMLNQELARHYGVDDVWGGELRRVNVGDMPQRSGLITQASILTMNSDGRDSHPIKRGVWLLERILHDPPPPPPPSVPDLDTNNPLLADMTLKEKIEHHRSLSACSGCHEKIDPWGVTMENFDATGRWRDVVTVNENSPARKIDASSILPDGTEIADFENLAVYLNDNKQDDLMESLVHHLMMYALGRELDILDELEAKSVKKTFRSSGYKFSDLVLAVVQTDAFTNRIQKETKLTAGALAYE